MRTAEERFEQIKFVVINGLIAGHDVGFDFTDMREWCKGVPEDQVNKVKQLLYYLVDDLSHEAFRVDGDNDCSREEWRTKNGKWIEEVFEHD